MAALAAGTIVTASALTGCGIGGKEHLAQNVIDAARRLDSAGTVSATVAVSVQLVKSKKPAVPGPPRIIPSAVPPLPSILDLRHDAAAVGVKGDDPSTATLLFLGSDLYERIPPKDVSVGVKVPSSAATNMVALLAVTSPSAVQLSGPGASLLSGTVAGPNASGAIPTTTTVPTTTTTAKPSALRRAPRVPRQWIGFDYQSIKDKDATKRAGSYALNPDVVLRLAQGVLSGSIKRSGPEPSPEGELTRYDANVSRDKAERRLPESQRKTLDKMFKANAISGHVFKASIWLDGKGALRRFDVTLRQSLTSIDRADLRVVLTITGTGARADIARPDPKATARVGSLGQLVTAVTNT